MRTSTIASTAHVRDHLGRRAGQAKLVGLGIRGHKSHFWLFLEELWYASPEFLPNALKF